MKGKQWEGKDHHANTLPHRPGPSPLHHQFSKKRNTAIRVLSATGTVSNVTLRQPAVVSAAVTFHGRFDLLSLSATVFPSPTTTSFSRGNIQEFCISLGGPGGQVVGGTVVGPLYAAATVYVVAASFNNPSFHRLPVEEEGEFRSCGDGEDNEGRSSPQVEHGGGYVVVRWLRRRGRVVVGCRFMAGVSWVRIR
ncbi:hypothetical protein C3L33_09238, partial [Rhododendron williamsianum]